MRSKLYYYSFLLGALALNSQHARAQYISTLAGDGFGAATGSGAYSGDGGLANHARLYSPTAVAFDGAGNVYIADYGNHVVRKVNTSGIISTIAGTGVAGFSMDTVAASTPLNHPSGVAVDVNGNVYIADHENYMIRKVTPAGKMTVFAGMGVPGYSGDNGPAIAALISAPQGLATDAAGNVYIADAANNVIRKINPAGTIITVAGTGTPGYSGNGGAAVAAQLNNPTGVAADNYGNLYIADMNNHVVRKVNASGIISTVAGNNTLGFSGDNGAAIAARLHYPSSVSVVGLNTLYIADEGNNRVRQVDSTGTIRTYAGLNTNGYSGDGGLATAAELSSPKGVAADGWGRVYIADYDNNVVRLVTLFPVTSGVESRTAEQAIVYPNPSKGAVTIALPQTDRATVQVIDMLGRVVLNKEYTQVRSAITLTDLPAGNCIVRIQAGDKVYRSQIVVTR